MNAHVPALVDAHGRPLTVGQRLGGGGEGEVYALSTTEVAKIYTAEPTARHVAKLEALVRAGALDAGGIAAWPREIVREPSGRVTGFVMPRIDGRVTIATAMNPGSRKAAFPQATWGWLIHVGRNLAAAMETLHALGVVVGDVNDSNVLVGADAVVRLIDVDSFQVREGAHLFACDVGMPIYQAPELYGRSYLGLERTPNHDRIGLAVLIFQLIFMGRHPWAGIWKDVEYEFDTGEVMAKLPFAFGRDAAAAGHRPPPDTVRLDWLPPATADLFERAFAQRGKARPSGAEWATALAAFGSELVACNASSMHRYAPSRGACPWCDLERRGLFLFITGGAAVPGAVYLDAATVQRHLDEIPDLTTFPVPATPIDVPAVGEPLERRPRFYRRAWVLSSLAGVLAALVATEDVLRDPHLIEALWGALTGAAFLARPRLGAIKRERRARLRAASEAYADAIAQWYAAANMSELQARKRDLQRKLELYRALPTRYTAERTRLEAEKPLHQMRAFLDRFLIRDAVIAGIGKKKRATLLSYGIETALDVRERLGNTYLPKFGEASRGLVFAWVRLLELRFRYDPSKPLDPRLLNDLTARENRERSDLERDLRGGPQALKALADQRIARREELRPQIVRLASEFASAEADLRALRRF